MIYPPGQEIFRALNSTTVEKTRVVIIGQDPYHGPGQAHGLAFSVRSGIPLPPSLVNILTEVSTDLGVTALAENKGDLSGWAEQGVLLLNSILTVEHGQAGSHQGRGWERFTDLVIKNLGELRESLVFMLWGNYAQKKGEFIDRDRHLVLTAPHPSPLSAHRGFFGCRHFFASQSLSDGQRVRTDRLARYPLRAFCFSYCESYTRFWCLDKNRAIR